MNGHWIKSYYKNLYALLELDSHRKLIWLLNTVQLLCVTFMLLVWKESKASTYFTSDEEECKTKESKKEQESKQDKWIEEATIKRTRQMNQRSSSKSAKLCRFDDQTWNWMRRQLIDPLMEIDDSLSQTSLQKTKSFRIYRWWFVMFNLTSMYNISNEQDQMNIFARMQLINKKSWR